ncbi:MAG: peptidyl-prolyl cis-trans isomerase [Myxococcales bacterium]|nr:peptidyl-prolyl cis-trans isomerase [Myxococcales bacterium]
MSDLAARHGLALVLLVATLAPACGDTGGGDTSGTTTSSATATDPTTDGTSGAATTSSDGTSTSGVDSSGDGSSSGGTESTGPAGPPQVAFETTLGTIVFELDPVAAPITTANFLTYVDGGFFEGADGNGATIFHRVIPGFVVQGGGLTESLEQKATLPPIVNESGNGLLNVRGAISMARTDDPDSATSQFFLNLVDNDLLDDPPGYAVFGSVIEGMEVVDAMAAVATTTMGQYEDVPVEPIVVLSVTRM